MTNNKRKCISSGTNFEKDKLIRIVKLKDGTFKINSDAQGRGAYILKNNESIQNVINKKILHKTFRMKVSEEVYKELEKEIKEK